MEVQPFPRGVILKGCQTQNYPELPLLFKVMSLTSLAGSGKVSWDAEKQLALLEARRSHGGGPNHMVNLPGKHQMKISHSYFQVFYAFQYPHV